jgi:hypothetical protein
LLHNGSSFAKRQVESGWFFARWNSKTNATGILASKMKTVVSISLGSSRRDHKATMTILNQEIHIRRIGVDGDFKRARKLFLDLDGQVDAFGMGGCEFGINFDGRYYPLRSVAPLVAGLKTPVVDGSGVRSVVEYGMARFLLDNIDGLTEMKRVFFCVASARYDMVLGFHEAGFEMKFGDPGFILGLPITSRSFWLARTAGRIFIPWVVRAPFSWLYPTGKKQLENKPRFRRWFDWAHVIADDFHYIKRHLPENATGKIIVTNTTTTADQQMLRKRGVKYLVTSTPLLDGRTFGTNVLEAAITAASGHSRRLSASEVGAVIDEMQFKPQVIRLN